MSNSTRGWIGGMMFAVGLAMFRQDSLGLQGYIEWVRLNWVDLHWSVGLMLALGGFALAFRNDN